MTTRMASLSSWLSTSGSTSSYLDLYIVTSSTHPHHYHHHFQCCLCYYLLYFCQVAQVICFGSKNVVISKGLIQQIGLIAIPMAIHGYTMMKIRVSILFPLYEGGQEEHSDCQQIHRQSLYISKISIQTNWKDAKVAYRNN